MRLVTLDANILVYSVYTGKRRQAAALEIIRHGALSGAALTLQAVGEFLAVSTRKKLASTEEALRQIERWLVMFKPLIAATPATLQFALQKARLGRFSFWDAMLLAAAEAAGCTAIISVDMAPGATLGRIRVVPAFAGDAVSPEALALLSRT